MNCSKIIIAINLLWITQNFTNAQEKSNISEKLVWADWNNNHMQGTFNVGFKTYWKLDSSRLYQLVIDSTIFVKRQLRPVLINIWYPTDDQDSTFMFHEEYLNIVSKEEEFKAFSTALVDYNLDVISQQYFSVDYNELENDQKKTLSIYMERKIPIKKGAKFPLKKQFPLVIYHSGAGSSFEDNAMLCEFLASHGYVVLGSAFQNQQGYTLSVDGGEGSFRDLEFLFNEANDLDFTDPKLILIGHSLGAQTILKYQATGFSKADVIVPIDATFEPHSIHFDHFWPSIPHLARSKDYFTNTLIGVSTEYSVFELYDLFHFSDRSYIYVQDIKHNEFISQGVIASCLTSSSKSKCDSLIFKYNLICKSVLLALSGNLNLSPSARSYGLNFERAKAKNAINFGIIDNPTPRQHFQYYKQNGGKEALNYLKILIKRSYNGPVFSGHYGFTLTYDLIESGDIKNAKVAYDIFNSNTQNDKTTEDVYNYYLKIGKLLKEELLVDDLANKQKLLSNPK